jgi:hypothetical protein
MVGPVIVAALILAVLAFVAVLRILDAAGASGRALSTVRAATTTLRSSTLSDDEKERAARRAAAGLFRSFVAITLICGAALAASAAVVWAGSAAGLYPLDALVATATDWPFLLASTVVGVAAWVATERLA